MARSSLVVMGAFVASKVVGLLRERAIAHAFGASREYDAYVAAFRVPDLLFTVIAGGALVTAFLPVFAEALARNERRDAWRIASGVTNLACIVTAILAAASAIGAPWLVAHLVAPGFDAAGQALTARLMRIILLGTVLFSVSGVQMGILNAFRHFLLPAIAPVAYNAGILAGAVWLAPRIGIDALAYGVVIGAGAHLLVKVPGLVRYGFRWYPTLDLQEPGLRRVLWLMWPRVLAMGTVQAAFLVNTRLASALVSGSLSALNYAWVLVQIPQTLLGTAVGTVAFPTLAEQAALDRRNEFLRTASGALRMLAAFTVPATAAIWVIGPPAISVLLRTGRFDRVAAEMTFGALGMYSLGLLGHVLLEVVARTFYARQDTRTPLVMAACAMAANIGLALALVGPFGHSGLAAANSLAVSLEVGLGLWLGSRAGYPMDAPRLLDVLVRSALASAGMVLAAHLAMARLGVGPEPAWQLELVRATVGAAAGGLAFLVLARALRLQEVGAGLAMVARAVRR